MRKGGERKGQGRERSTSDTALRKCWKWPLGRRGYNVERGGGKGKERKGRGKIGNGGVAYSPSKKNSCGHHFNLLLN